MTIRFSKKQIRLNLILGIIWLANGILQVFFDESPSWLDYSWFLFSVIYLGTVYYQKTRKYVTLENNTIKKNQPFGKSIRLQDIKQVRLFAGDVILRSEHTEFTVNGGLACPDGRDKLIALLREKNIAFA